MRDELRQYNYATLPLELDRKRDEVELSPQVRMVLGEVLRQTIGFTGKDGINHWGHELSPEYISRKLGTDETGKRVVSRNTVRYAYKVLEERKIISKRRVRWEDTKKPITWVEVNNNLSEWRVR